MASRRSCQVSSSVSLVGEGAFLSLGEAGLGASVGPVATSKDFCSQAGWAFSADVSVGAATAGGSVAADPLPNESGALWQIDSSNSQLRAGASAGLVVSGGPAYTWVIGQSC